MKSELEVCKADTFTRLLIRLYAIDLSLSRLFSQLEPIFFRQKLPFCVKKNVYTISMPLSRLYPCHQYGEEGQRENGSFSANAPLYKSMEVIYNEE